MLSLLATDPALFLIVALSLVYGITVHEFGHALAGTLLGDDTAKRAGRLTLNPLAHLDPLGTIMIFVTGLFGWGKPTPYNPYNLRSRRYGSLLVGMAGPAMNLLSILLFGALLWIMSTTGWGIVTQLFRLLIYLVMLNVVLMVFNLIPVPPLDGSKFLELLPARFAALKEALFRYGPMLLLGFILLDAFVGVGLLARLFGALQRFFLGLFL